MTDEQIQEIAEQLVHALQNMTKRESQWWTFLPVTTSLVALSVVLLLFGIGVWTLNQQQKSRLSGALDGAGELGRDAEADAMSEWWTRALWALEAAASTSGAKYTYGTTILGVLAKSHQASPEEKKLFDVVWQVSYTSMQDKEIDHLIEAFGEVPPLNTSESPSGYSSTPGAGRPGAEGHPPISGLTGTTGGASYEYSGGGGDAGAREQLLRTLRREILAARLKVTLDGQLGRESSAAVKRLAEMKIPI